MRPVRWLVRGFRRLGPGLVSGASTNDPTTVGTMAVAGASTGFALSWLALLVFPMLASVQLIASQVGLTSRVGLVQLVRRTFGARWALLLLLSVLAVNAVTIGADVEAGAAALSLLVPVPQGWFVLPFAAVLLVVLWLGTYDEVEQVLKFVLLVFLSYVGAAFLARPDWSTVLTATLRPRLPASPELAAPALSIVGTTLTSYAYVWQEQGEVEKDRPQEQTHVARVDTVLGMAAAVGVFWFVLIATGATLGARHQQVQTAQQAAEALRPLAGNLASYVFGVGLLASSCVAVPVLMLTSAHLVCQQVRAPAGISKRPRDARLFYLVLVVALLVGCVISFAGIPPITLLFLAGLAGGLATPVGLVFLMLMAHRRAGSGVMPLGMVTLGAGWATTAAIVLASILFVLSQV